VAAVGIERLAVIWDTEAGKEITRWSADSIFPLALAFSRDSKRLAIGGADQIIRLWEIEQGKLVASLRGHHNEIWALAFSPDGQILVSASKDGTVRLWSAKPESATGRGLTRGAALHFSTDGSTLALFSTNSTVQNWDVRSKHLVSTSRIPDRPNELDSIDASPDGRLLALVGTNGTARVWDRVSGELIAELLLDSPPKWPCAVFSPDSRLLAISSGPRDVGDGGWSVVWDFRLRKRRALPGEDVYRPTFSPDGRIMATGSGSDVQLWSIPDLKPLATLRGHKWTINWFAFSPDSSVLASAGRDNNILLWEVAAGKLRGVLSGHQTSAGRPAFSSDGRTLASVAAIRVILWNVATGRELLTMSALDRHLNSCMFSPDGNTLVVSGTQSEFAMATIELLQAQSLAEIEAVENASAQSR
jgi:WD40 repeat protein